MNIFAISHGVVMERRSADSTAILKTVTWQGQTKDKQTSHLAGIAHHQIKREIKTIGQEGRKEVYSWHSP